MNLANMLLEIQQRKARMDAYEDQQRRDALNKQYEDMLAQLSIRATQMIEQNYNALATQIDGAFGRHGLDVLPPFNDFMLEDADEWLIRADAHDAWQKFEEGWRKAGIRVSIVEHGMVRFQPIVR